MKHDGQEGETLRQRAVKGARCMVRVRRRRDGRVLTMAVCPACFNTPEGRERILRELAAEGCDIVSRRDGMNGDFPEGFFHMPGCLEGNRRKT